MEDNKRKKVSDFMWWLIIVSIIAWGISQHPGYCLGLAIIIGIFYYCSRPTIKSADTNEKEEETEEPTSGLPGGPAIDPDNPPDKEIEEIKPDFTIAGEKTDSFYSGVSEKPPIDKRPVE